MAGTSGFDPDRIYVQLNNTSLQQKDARLYQVIYQMIQELARLRVDSSSSSSSGGSSSVVNNNTNQFLDLLSGSGDSSSDSFSIPGRDGLNGRDGLIGPPGLDGNDGYDLSPLGFSINNSSSEITITTTGNIDDLDFGNVALIRMNNASLSTIRGLKAGYAGQIVTIISVGAGQVDLAHQNTNSAAGNRFINFATSGNSSLAAASGNASYKYDGTTSRWRLVTHNQGASITPTFSAGNFTAVGAMTWTVDSGDVLDYSYILEGKKLTVWVALVSTTIGGVVGGTVFVAIPGGFLVQDVSLNNGWYLDILGTAVAAEVGYFLVLNGDAIIRVARLTNTNYVLTTNTMSVIGTAIFTVQ